MALTESLKATIHAVPTENLKMPDNTDMPDFDFPEGMVPGGPADEANADPMDYFEGDDYPEDPDAIVPREIVPEGSIQEGVTTVKPKSRTPKIAAAAVAIAVAAGGGAYWYFGDSGGSADGGNNGGGVVGGDAVGSAGGSEEGEKHGKDLAARDQQGDLSKKTTADLLEIPFEKLTVGEGAATPLEKLLTTLESGKVDRPTYDKFLEWTKLNETEISKDAELKERVGSCAEWLNFLFAPEQPSADVVPARKVPVSADDRIGQTHAKASRYQFVGTLATALRSTTAIASFGVLLDEQSGASDQVLFEDESEPVRKRLPAADRLIRSLKEKDPKTATVVCDKALLLLRNEWSGIGVEISDLEEVLKGATDAPETRLISSKISYGRGYQDNLQKWQRKFVDYRTELMNAQLERLAASIAEMKSSPTESNLTFASIREKLEGLQLAEEFSGLTSQDDVDNLAEPELTGMPTEEELKEFKATRRGVGMAVVAVEEILTDKPQGEFLTTEDAANVMTQLQNMRTGSSEMKLMKLMIANRPEPSETAKPGLTPAQVNATLAGLEIPDDVDSIPSPAQATPAQQTEFVDLRKSVKNWKEQILDALKDSTTKELLPLDMPLPDQVAEEVTTKIEQLRSGWFQLQARRLTPGGSGGTSYVYAEGDTVAAFQAALNGIGLPKDLSTLKLVHATEEQQAEFDKLAKVIETARTGIQTDLKDKPDEEKLSPEVATLLTGNLGTIRDAYFDMKTRILISQLPPSEASEMAILVTSVTKPSEVRAVLTGLGLPEVLDTLQLAQSASEPQRTEFEKLRTRVSDAQSKIDTLLEGTSPDEVLPEMDLSQVSSRLESIRLALVEMGAHVAVSNYVPGAGAGTGSAPQITITRERLMAFLDAIGLPERMTQIQPPSQKPESVPQSQYDYQQTVWNALKSDVEALKQRSSSPKAPSPTKLTEDEVQDSRTRMDRVLVNLLRLETAAQIAALRFPESSSQSTSQSTMIAACIPSWVATDSELSNVMAQLRQEMGQLSSTSATISSGPTIEQVHQVVFQETQGIREDLDRKIADALTQPRTLIPEQVQKLEESTTGRVMKILSESALPPLTLPPDPSDISESASGLDRSKAPGQYRQGSAMFFSSEFDGNQKAMDHFSAAAKLDPRNPTYRYFLALTLRRSGQTVEAARQARIGASLEARRDRTMVSNQLEHVQGESRAWLERLRVGL